MLRKLYTIAFVGVMASGQAALAGNQTVVITEGGFFPEITYLKPRDAVEFVNRDEVSHTVSNADGDWSFTIEPNAAKKIATSPSYAEAYSSTAENHDGSTLTFDAPPAN